MLTMVSPWLVFVGGKAALVITNNGSVRQNKTTTSD